MSFRPARDRNCSVKRRIGPVAIAIFDCYNYYYLYYLQKNGSSTQVVALVIATILAKQIKRVEERGKNSGSRTKRRRNSRKKRGGNYLCMCSNDSVQAKAPLQPTADRA